ncbi:MAG: sulfite exporter TauE/SafE family protein [Prevotella sp.]|jgi:uncharacterized membrane protein YfcA|nr:sulfite exporter TauE/SafE family protein [Prevotella sp.]
MNILLILTGFVAGMLSSSIGFGGGMVLLPVVTYFFGIEVAVPVCTLAQLLSNFSRVIIGLKDVKWKQSAWFLVTSVPLTVLGAYGFAIAPKSLMTKVVSIFLIIFAILKLRGKIHLPHRPATMLIGGGVTGLINGLLSISGPLSSAVFLSLDLSPVSYIASEAFAATVMHVIKLLVYGKLNLVTLPIVYNGLAIAVAMIVGNFIAMKTIGHIKGKIYQKVVAGCMIVLSLFLFFTA